MTQRLQDMDGFILMEFAKVAKEMKRYPKTQKECQAVTAAGQPFMSRLLSNGHSVKDASALLADVFMENSQKV